MDANLDEGGGAAAQNEFGVASDDEGGGAAAQNELDNVQETLMHGVPEAIAIIAG